MLLDLLGFGSMFAKRRTIVFALALLVSGVILLHGAGVTEAPSPPIPSVSPATAPTATSGDAPAVMPTTPVEDGWGETIAGMGLLVVGTIFLVLAIRDIRQGRLPRD